MAEVTIDLNTNDKGVQKKKSRWSGLLRYDDPLFNRITAIVMLIVLASLTYMQLGFIGIGTNGVYIAYIMTPLAFVAAASLLYGTKRGTLFGLAAGLILFSHSRFQPLDVYERFLVGPFNSILLLTFCGFLTGVFFRIALKNHPQGWRKWLYIAIACFLIALIETILFFVNGIAEIVCMAALSNYNFMLGVTSDGVGAATSQLYSLLGSLGQSLMQLPFNFVFMLLACALAFFVAKQHAQRAEQREMRTIFQVWLLVVVICAHLVTNAIAFAINTELAKKSAFTRMRGEIDYITKQIDQRTINQDVVIDLLREAIDNGITISDQTKERLNELTGVESILDGYDLDSDGTIVVFAPASAVGETTKGEGDVVFLSNDTRYPIGATLEECYGVSAKEAFTDLSRTDGVIELIYNRQELGSLPTLSEMGTGEAREAIEDIEISTLISYVKAGVTGDYIVVMEMPSTMVFSNRLVNTLTTSLSALVLLSAVYVLAAVLLKRVVTDKMEDVNGRLEEITDGKLDTKVVVRSSVEFAKLSDGINTTVDAMNGWIHEAETRMAQDLKTAKAIQESNLPRTFPPFPEIDRFDIYASMNAAKEVGGDFFDFFLIDDQTLGFLIADVSGKGIPGALFMMAAKSEIENHMQTGMKIEEAIAGANARLCANNDADMFVTVWAATLNYQTGELTYVNAGHNPPLLRHNGEWSWMRKKCGLFLGTFATAKYRSDTITIEEGDEILLYTDGVNEAFSAEGEEYGNDRLEAFMADHVNEHPRELVNNLRKSVADWAEGAEQSDDITMVCLEYGVAPEASGTETYVATLDNLPAMMEPIQKELSDRLCPMGVMNKIEIALEEMLVNVCRYAYASEEQPGKVQVSYVYTGNPSSITVELRDWGVPFDPLTRKDPTAPASIQEAKIGGLGIFMTKKSVDDMSYMRDDDANVVVFKKSW